MPEPVTFAAGIMAQNGQYACQVSDDDLYAAVIQDIEAITDEEVIYTEQQAQAKDVQVFGLADYYEPEELTSVHWGAIIPPPPYSPLEEEHLRALGALVAHRQALMKTKDVFICEYQAGWSCYNFLNQYGAVPGQVVPTTIPYYLCIVGSPQRIPWEFQQYLDGDYAVGRLWFDEPGDVARYVERVLAYEPLPGAAISAPSLGKWALFSAVQHPDDIATQGSSVQLTVPLQQFFAAHQQKLENRLLLGTTPGSEASKENFTKLLVGDGAHPKPPAILFTSSHGYETDELGASQELIQGAPLFQEYPGPFHPMKAEYCLAGAEAEELALPVAGSVWISYACFSAGTPLKQDWVMPGLLSKPHAIAKQPFVARLPQKLLALGMLGFVGHVSRTSRFAYQSTKLVGQHIEPYKNMLYGLAKGQRIGNTTRLINEQWAALNGLLDIDRYKNLDKETLINTWLARNDLRGFVLLGDPAARLPL